MGKEQRKLIAVEIAAKDKEIDAVQVEIDAQSNKIKSMSDKETDSRGKIQALLNERDEIRAKMKNCKRRTKRVKFSARPIMLGTTIKELYVHSARCNKRKNVVRGRKSVWQF